MSITYNELLDNHIKTKNLRISKIAEDLEISTQTLRNWRNARDNKIEMWVLKEFVHRYGLDLHASIDLAGDGVGSRENQITPELISTLKVISTAINQVIKSIDKPINSM